ncbi:MAG: riboflavin biosynthesis protein RibF [Oscillospiraceae bacterium]|jgi:riboflavin kinase/FMN adenylyltransferase|nr:riboflavin biosynthesis protein RibF [Oscillospiraceae bacterium]
MNKANRALALGSFDGLHLAHRAVLEGACAFARAGLSPAVLLFRQHPMALLRGSAPPRLLEDRVRDETLTGMGLTLLTLDFAECVKSPPEEFFKDTLCGRFGAAALCCGYDYRFGLDRRGDAALLAALCAHADVALRVVPELDYAGEAISSTRIRAALARGDLHSANAMLGRPFGYCFPVRRGDRLGRSLGAATLNQHFPPGFAVPRFGVYASQAFVEGVWRDAVTNIGRRPSFQSDELRSETHILGFEGDLYGQEIPVQLLRFLRPERRFQNLEELRAQIFLDKKNARGETDGEQS